MNPSFKYKWLWLLIGYALVAFVLYQSITSSPIQGPQFPFQDKVFHVLAYLALMGWFAQIYHLKSQRLIIAFLFVAMGLLMEFVQSFDPNRYAEFADMVANTVGVVVGFLITKTKLKNVLLRVEQIANKLAPTNKQ